MKSGRPCPKCGSTAIVRYESVRSGGGPLSVGHFAADALTVFSQFEAYTCQTCGYTEFYRSVR